MEWGTTTIFARLDSADCAGAWVRLNSRFRTPIIHIAQEMGLTPEEAEDAAQDSLIAFHTSLREGRYDPCKGRASTWLFGIAIRQILNRRRKRNADLARVQFGKSTSFWDNAPTSAEETAHWVKQWKRIIINEYLEQIRSEVEPVTFHAFELVARVGKTPRETASTLGISIKAVYNAKHRILKRLREIRAEHEQPIFEGTVCRVTT